MDATGIKALQREILLSLWKIHILHHAAEGPVVGQWMIQELRHHGYEVSPGTMYPLLARLEKRGWLSLKANPSGGLRSRKEYTLTRSGRDALAYLRKQIKELQLEVIGEDKSPRKKR